MLSKLLLGAVLTLGSIGYASASTETKTCDIFTQDQIKVLQFAHDKGKPYDLQWTLAAIAWQESSAGLKHKNPKADSYGIFGSLLTTVEARLKDKEFADSLRKVPLNRKQTIFLLKHDWEFSSEFALAELTYWQDRHKNDHRKTVSSYFGGNRPNTTAAKGYAKSLNEKIRFLKQTGCIHG